MEEREPASLCAKEGRLKDGSRASRDFVQTAGSSILISAPQSHWNVRSHLSGAL
jgi:hypothetical protein